MPKPRIGDVAYRVVWVDATQRVCQPYPPGHPDRRDGYCPFNDGEDPEQSYTTFRSLEKALVFARSLVRRRLDFFGQVEVDQIEYGPDPECPEFVEWREVKTWDVTGPRKSDIEGRVNW